MSESEVKETPQNGVAEKPIQDAVGMNESDDKLDEFSRLEMEMAELDKTDHAILGAEEEKPAPGSSDVLCDEKGKIDVVDPDDPMDGKGEALADSSTARQNGDGIELENVNSALPVNVNNGNDEVLDHADLIAVLKGETNLEDKQETKDERKEEPTNVEESKDAPTNVETPNDKTTNVEASTNKPTNVKSPEGKPSDAENDLLIEGVTIEGEGEYQIMEVIDDMEDEGDNLLMPLGSKVLNVAKASTSSKLTPEEERAMAMEQIAGLNARGPRRRKQDIKPIQLETSELVSTLGDDWTDDEEDIIADSERPTSSKSAASAAKQVKTIKKDALLPNPEVSSLAGDAKSTVPITKKRRSSVTAKVTSVVTLVKSPAAGDVATTDDVADSSVAAATPQPPTPTGFKRTRIIKRRIIWDPDEPGTSFSFAKLVRKDKKDAREPHLSIIKKARSVTPKAAAVGEKKGTKRSATPLQLAASKAAAGESVSKIDDFEIPSTSKQARRAQTQSPDVSSGSTGSAALTGGKKKKISEIDRLMGDEGAANMLNSLESGRSKLGEDSDDKPHKPLMRNRSTPAEKAGKKEVPSTSAATTTASPTKNKRGGGPKPKPSTSWDYVYKKKQQLSDDSMIIRRRSNSSYSSNASQHRLSLDGPSSLGTTKSNAKSAVDASSDDAGDSGISPVPRKSSSKSSNLNTTDDGFESASTSLDKSASGSKTFEFAKPKDTKSNQKAPNRRSKGNLSNTLTNDIKKAMPKRGPRRSLAANVEQSPAAQSNIASNSQTSSSTSTAAVASAGEEISVRKLGKTTHISLNMSGAQLSCTYTPQLMNKIVGALSTLAEDVNCHVVVVTTDSAHFCQGIDIGNLATGSAEQRKSAAIVLAKATKNFLRTLATFPKPLVAGIHGTLIGLGVTQLPLFDVVIASDKTCLETPYAKIGQIPEGYCIWQCLSNVNETAKTKLLWLAEKMQANEAAKIGLIDKLTTPEKVNDDAMNTAKKLASMSAETYRSMKQFNIRKRLSEINSSLDDEFDEITAQWTSAECFSKFKKCLENGHF